MNTPQANNRGGSLATAAGFRWYHRLVRATWGLSLLHPAWVHCNGESSHTSVCLASFHHPDSITWRWALYWNKNLSWASGASTWKAPNGNGSISFRLPWIGGLSLAWQEHMWL